MIRKYIPSDYEQVMGWLDKRGMKRIHPNVLSEYGLIIPGKVAAWIYMTNSDLCYIENLIGNPEDCTKDDIRIILDTLTKFARDSGYKFVLSVTEHKGVIAEALKRGAKIQGNQSLITLQLY